MTRKRKPVPEFSPAEIRAMRTERGLTQEQAAAVVGVTRETWAFWEVGSRVPAIQSRILLDLFRRRKI